MTLLLQTDKRFRGSGALHWVPLPHNDLNIFCFSRSEPQQIQDGVLVIREDDVALETNVNKGDLNEDGRTVEAERCVDGSEFLTLS